MILGEPDIDAISDFIMEEGCPRCGERPGWIDMTGPGQLVLEGCGHRIDVRPWIQGSEL